MKINKIRLQEALEIVKPGLANKELIEQSTSFAFMNGKVITYNDEISISHPVEGLELEGAILADNLYKFLGKVKKDDIDLSVEENEIILTTGKAKAGLTLQTEIKLPLDEELNEKGRWQKLPENFINDIAFVMTAAGSNMSQPLLTCVHIHNSGFVEASDSYRFARRQLSAEMPIGSVLIPALSVVEITKLDPKPTRVAEGKGWIHFRNSTGTIISCRIFEDRYKDLSPFLKVEGTRVVFPEGLDEILARAMVFSKRDHMLEEEIVIIIKDKILKMAAKSDSGWFREETDMPNFKGEPIKFVITPYLLKGILSETKVCELTHNRIKFEGTGWIYISILKDIKEKK
jgi:DNA polymerase III sliding clamp (beta) subunit (PCNA family)